MGEACDRRPCIVCGAPIVWHHDGRCTGCDIARTRALNAARDELVRAAVALNAAHSDIALVAPVDPTSAVVSRRLAWSDFRAAVAAYEKLAKP